MSERCRAPNRRGVGSYARAGCGNLGRVIVGNGLRVTAHEQAVDFLEEAEATERSVDWQYLVDHLPLNLDIDQEPLWEEYDQYGAREMLRECFYKPLLKEVNLE